MSAEGRFFVTPHAVNRYREHFSPKLSYESALGELVLITSTGRHVGPYIGEKLSAVYPGAQLWRARRIGPRDRQDKRSRMRFVVGSANPGDLPQVITVLPAPGRARDSGSRVAATRPEPMARRDGQKYDTSSPAACTSAFEQESCTH